MSVLQCLSSFEDISYEKLQDTAASSFVCCCFILALEQHIPFFYNFLERHSKLSEKRFSTQIFIAPYLNS